MSTGYKTKSIKDVQRENVRKSNQRKGEMRLLSYIALGIVGIIVAIFMFAELTKQSYLLKIGSVKIGYVSNSKAAMAMIEKVKKQIEDEVQTEIKIVEQPSTDSLNVAYKADSEETIMASLKDKLTYNIKVFTIHINGKEIATLPNAKSVNEVLNEVKNKYDENKTVVDFVADAASLKQWFKEEVTIATDFLSAPSFSDVGDAINKIGQQGTTNATYVIKEGDMLSKIARENGVKSDDILKMNPELKEKALQIGQKINIGISPASISVITRVQTIYDDVIPKKIITKENSNKYTNEKTVITPGKDGKKTVTANIVKVNGVETGKEVIKEEVILEPTEETVEIGTKKLASRGFQGIFSMPTRGSITAIFGEQRLGYRHKGVDIANEIGTPIYAAGSGRVCETGYDAGGYGNYIKVEHANGFITLYGHLSKIFVNEGTKVVKNDKIASMGNTGDSSGSHLHFEIMKDGEKLNPLKYVR